MNYYEILGVPHNANKELIVSAFRKLAKEYHPDRNKNPNASKIFVKIYEAYKILSDDNKRKLYDETIFVKKTDDFNKEYEDYVKKAQYEGNTLSKQKYRKVVYHVFSSVKKRFFTNNCIYILYDNLSISGTSFKIWTNIAYFIVNLWNFNV